MQKWFRRLWRGKVHVQNVAVFLSAVLVTALIFTEVVLRYVFNSSLAGINEMASFAAVWLYFLGAAVASERGVHISASLTDLFIRDEKKELAIRMLADLFSIGAAIWMAIWAWQYSLWTLNNHMMSLEIGIQMGLINIVIPIGLSLMTLYLLADLVRHAKQFAGRGGR